MKRSQPQCILSVDISTCGDTGACFHGKWGETHTGGVQQPGTRDQSLYRNQVTPSSPQLTSWLPTFT